MIERITALPANGQECDGCRHQVWRGQRKNENVKPAEYLCDNCGKPLCADHIQYERRGDWWLCAYCLVSLERMAERRAARR